jgi:outer membrane protein assembly factor BamB
VTSIEVFGTLGGQVRAFNIRGRTYWSFFASASVVSAVVIDETTNIFYAADTSGRVFAGQLTSGALVSSFSFAAKAGITASMALGRDSPTAPTVPSLYVADQGGTLYALDRSSGAIRWTFQADGPISSSPAVATGGSADVIVFAADILEVLDPRIGPVAVDGLVYAVRDDGDQGTLLWTFDANSSIGSSSPSIGADGTVYIGRAGTRLGSETQCADRNGDGVPDPCLVNEGGACFAIPPRS